MKLAKPSTHHVFVKKAPKFKIFKQLLSFCKAEYTGLSIGFAALIVNAVTNLSLPWLLGQAVDQDMLHDSDKRFHFIVASGSFFVVASFASFVRVYFLGNATNTISRRLRQQLFQSFIDKDMDFYDETKKGQLIEVISKDVAISSEVLTEKMAAGLRSMNSAIAGSVLLFRISPFLFTISISVLPIIGIVSMRISKKNKVAAERMRESDANVTSFAIERFHSITTIRLNGREAYENELFACMINDYTQSANESVTLKSYLFSFINLSTSASLMAVLYVGGNLLREGKLTSGELTKFALQSAFVGLGWSGLSTFYDDMNKGLDATARVFEVIDNSNSNDSVLKQSSSSSSAAASVMSPNLKLVDDVTIDEPRITFKNVSFAYSGRSNVPIFKDFNLRIEPNAITAIVGKSGAGKSTALALITGLYRPTAGDICLGGTSITGMNLSSIRQFIGVVEQSIGLLSGTIYDNIAYGKENASLSDVTQAAQLADIHDFIVALPEGYQTKLGEIGKSLSGGQKARIAIARALIRDPKYLLLDEATAALDRTSESEIATTFQRLSKDKTILIFTHSEVMMRIAKVVHVLQDGVIAASAPYHQLQTSNHFYLADLIN